MVKNNIFSIIVALVIMYLSLASSDTFDEVPFLNIPFLDKILHFGIYFVLMSVMLYENRKRIFNTHNLLLIALIPFFYGILMEILQLTVTISRSGSIFDVVSNLAGIMTSLLLYRWIVRFSKKTIR